MDPLEDLDLQDQSALKALEDCLDPKANLVKLDLLDQLDHKDQEERLVYQDQMVHPDHKVKKD